MTPVEETSKEFVSKMRSMSRGRWRFLTGAKEFLCDVRNLGIPTALCSNQTAVWASEVMTVLSIQEYFDVIVFSCDAAVEASKSHDSLRIYQRLKESLQLGLNRDPEVVYFWDDRFQNTTTAWSAGLRPYWVDLSIADPVHYMRFMLDRILDHENARSCVLCYDLGGLFVPDHAEDLLWGANGFADEYHLPSELVKLAHKKLWYDDKFATTPPTSSRPIEQLEFDYYTRLATYTGLGLAPDAMS